VLELIEWDTRRDYDRLGFEEEKYRILEGDLPMMKIPVTPARNLSTIIEVAARNHRLKMMGYHSALEFEKKLLQKLQEKGRSPHAVEDEAG
jgi:HPr kinase/phosphorylase